MAKKYLDYSGLQSLWTKIKNTFALASHNHTKSQITDFSHSHVKSDITNFGHTHGNIQDSGDLNATDVAIANGDKLVITDASNYDHVAKSGVTFDGTTTNKALTPKGTFETFLQSHQNAYRAVKVGSTSVTAASAGDTLELEAGTGVTLTPNTSSRKVTIASTAMSDFEPATSQSADGTHGLVPAPTVQMYLDGLSGLKYYLSGDGGWELLPVQEISETNGTIEILDSTLNSYLAVSDSAVGAASGVCPLDSSGKVDSTYLPAGSGGVSFQVLSATKSYSTNSERVSLSNGTTAATILSVTAPVTGYVIVTGHVQMTANQNGNRHAEITKGNTVLAQTTQRAGSSGQTTIVQVSWAGECTQGDTIAIKAWQTAGSSTTLYAGGILAAMFIG